jgi:hypothetical protein
MTIRLIPSGIRKVFRFFMELFFIFLYEELCFFVKIAFFVYLLKFYRFFVREKYLTLS